MSVKISKLKRVWSGKGMFALLVGLSVLLGGQLAMANSKTVVSGEGKECVSYQISSGQDGRYYLVEIQESCGFDHFMVRMYSSNEAEVVIPDETGVKVVGNKKRLPYVEDILYLRITCFVDGEVKEYALRVPTDITSKHI